MMDDATIIGGGPCGSLLAMMLVDLGFDVEVFELRNVVDVATTATSARTNGGGSSKVTSATRRSINLAVSHRGLCALRKVGLADEVLSEAVEMHSRYVHLPNGQTAEQRYGGPGDSIYSVSRPEVVELLSAEAERRGVRFRRGEKLVGFDDSCKPVFASGARASSSGPVFGCDGAFSTVRRSVQRLGRFNTRVWYAKEGYKELEMPPSADGKYVFPPNYLHIWPRGEMMLTALPNLDGSFTVTLFAPNDQLEDMEDNWSREDVAKFFEDNFTDAAKFMPSAVNDFFSNPTAPLVQVQLDPWHFQDKILCLGDASHAVLPFYGQGMNAAFEDCLELTETLAALEANSAASPPGKQKYLDHLHAAFKHMSTKRRQAADGLSALAAMNYHDMASNTASALYRTRKCVESYVAAYFPSYWKPLYSMVTFSRIPYHKVLLRHERQEQVLTAICSGLAGSIALILASTAASFLRRNTSFLSSVRASG